MRSSNRAVPECLAHIADVYEADQPASLCAHAKVLTQHQQAVLQDINAFTLDGLVEWRKCLRILKRLQGAALHCHLPAKRPLAGAAADCAPAGWRSGGQQDDQQHRCWAEG